jgi:hypothetical protein
LFCGGGGLSDLGGDENGGTDGSEETPPETFDPFKDSNSLEDRLQVILSTAESIAEQTQDPQKVLKAVKGLIQNGFKNPDQAARAISDLFDTDNPVVSQSKTTKSFSSFNFILNNFYKNN